MKYKITINDPRPDHKIPVAEMTLNGDTTIKDIIGWRACIVEKNPEDYPILVEVVR